MQKREEKLDEVSVQIESAETRQSEKNANLNQAKNQLSSSKSRDKRSFLLKVFFKTEEVRHAKQVWQIASVQKKKADSLLSALKAELVKATEDFDRQLVACRPNPYRPSFAEREEREKLESRKTELLNTQRHKKTIRKG